MNPEGSNVGAETGSWRRTVGWLLVCGLAWVIQLLGYIAPLTPSEGTPSIGTLIFWVGVPIGLVALAEWKLGSRNTWMLAAAQVLAMVLVTTWILRVVFG